MLKFGRCIEVSLLANMLKFSTDLSGFPCETYFSGKVRQSDFLD